MEGKHAHCHLRQIVWRTLRQLQWPKDRVDEAFSILDFSDNDGFSGGSCWARDRPSCNSGLRPRPSLLAFYLTSTSALFYH